MSMAVLSSLLLAGATLSAGDRAALDARVKEMFRPYRGSTSSKSSWEYPIFSGQTTALIAHWMRVQPKDEPDDLNDGDWFCLCQDFDAKTFRATAAPARLIRPAVAEVRVRVHLGFGESRDERLVLTQEADGWRLDDLFAAPDFPRGLKQKLRETIAADEALARGRR